ncbi:indole-3-glycerol phosphate synthase [Crocosphaera subtropica ATCC 51142]|uniref:Indole-3-glycerol phosphate synthase n=1 Tax=Crocosphaera subtropica (strain ATCC 51142 / BH68) TaxID=43989 RepID=TRPC_CROS5|nr:indole-3-glycerol phosphate synthase TrpC [Crocosphaera subtropica]B1WQE4.1 RecName: Full=Indole-3-glycerol phosphate synthase; Short=IGPS [Crocosphaera subtropica ATCC 51142]ACB51655.1 indole-3-glycerol phosphate synthase [Crocosphaera subtropica ATCC 51142]
MQIRRRPPNPAVEVDILRYQVPDPNGKANHILEEIVWHKEKEVERMRDRLSLLDLRKQEQSAPPAKDFLGAISQGKTQPALIAEVKKASPSKGVIREDFEPVAIAQAYVQGGASCLSVLTDSKFFQGSFDNLALVRQAVDIPLLCKEFIIYPYQIYLARVKGADAILLIAAILKDSDLQYLIKIIHGLGMTPLVEVHSLAELDRVLAIEGVSLVGINNRNLETFEVSLETTTNLITARQDEIKERGIYIVSESGIHTPQHLQQVTEAGANAVLIGESLVKQDDPTQAIANLFSF